MPSYEVCQHCSHSVRNTEAAFKGYSYHRHCRKCYVCSETDLHGAEVFRGVIFCSSCARRIFRGCSSARRARPARTQRRRQRPPVHGVIERARAQSCTSSSQNDSKTETAVPARDPRTCPDCYCVSDVVTQARRLINFIYYQTQNLIKNDTEDIAQCTEMCQRMLADVKCTVPEPRVQAFPIPPQPDILRNSMAEKMSSIDIGTCHSRSRFYSKRRNKKKMKKEKPCSDLRIAELGTSVEIANMALRKTSTKKVQSEFKIIENADEPETISMFTNVDSVNSHTSNEEYLDSECHDYRGSKELERGIPDQILKYIVKHPCKFFKKKVLERSSLISVIAGINSEKDYRPAYERLKMLFHDEVLDHQHNGYKKLYSTINKKNTPFKLGWLEADIPGDHKTYPCRHYHQCHSYRCMRKQVMRLAGPTKSAMDMFRKKLKKFVVPTFLKRISFQYKTPAIVKPQLRIKSDDRLPKSSWTPKSLSHEKRNHESRSREKRNHESRSHEKRNHESRSHEKRNHESRSHEKRKRDSWSHERRKQESRLNMSIPETYTIDR